MKLTDSTIRIVTPKKTAQKLSDGGGLFLHVLPNGSKHWRMAYRYGGKQKLLSFGLPRCFPCAKPGINATRPRNCCWTISTRWP